MSAKLAFVIKNEDYQVLGAATTPEDVVRVVNELSHDGTYGTWTIEAWEGTTPRGMWVPAEGHAATEAHVLAWLSGRAQDVSGYATFS